MKRLAFVVILAALLIAPAASGYIIIRDNQGNPLAWNASPVPWAVAANGSKDVPMNEVEAALKAAFASWENVGCTKVSFNYGGKVSSNPANGIFIRWLEDNWDLTVQDALGVTTNWKLNPGGGAKKVEIFFNGKSYQWATSGSDDPFSNTNDIQAVATHEIGHAIGLDHPRHRTSTMWFTTFGGESEEARSLEPDDERGACFLYPAVTFKQGQACDACWSNNGCEDGLCIDFGQEGPHCGRDCSANDPCPETFSCFQLQGADSPQCLPDNDHCAPVGGNIATGQFCYDHSTCASSLCLVLPDGAVCSQNCNPSAGGTGGCPTGMACAGQGTNGICYPKGDNQLGETCLSAADCLTFNCIGVGGGQGVCTQPCDNATPCPGSMTCSFGFCVSPGSGEFGDDCETLLQCQSAFCVPFANYCSQSCKVDGDCPATSKCIAESYCDAGATGEKGETCGPKAKECMPGLFCFYKTAAAELGTCESKCDVRYDDCKSNELCQWVWQDWSQKVVGLCVADNGGAGLGAACGGSAYCKPGMVCADTDGTGAKCRQDCNAANTLGCAGGATCVALKNMCIKIQAQRLPWRSYNHPSPIERM